MAVIILRGLPGSGKSTWIAKNTPEAEICSSDHFMMEDGVYKFDRNKLPKSHAQCLQKYVELVRSSRKRIVVDNTNISIYEIAPYYQVASAYNHRVRIVTLKVSVETSIQRNIHRVDEDVIVAMHRNLEIEKAKFPSWWIHEEVDTDINYTTLEDGL